MAVMGYLELAFGDIESSQKAAACLVQVRKSAEEAAEVSKLMLAYLGRIPTRAEPLDLAHVCREELKEQEIDTLKEGILRTDILPHGPIIATNRAQVLLVFTNLPINAREAIGENEGDILVSTCVLKASDMLSPHVFPVGWKPQSDAYACTEVFHTGCGIQPENLDPDLRPLLQHEIHGTRARPAGCIGSRPRPPGGHCRRK
jgi:two-component system, cell cycle sensor histidine kinase and response regulator CckA